MERLKGLGDRNTRYVHVSINFKDSTEPLTFTSVVIFDHGTCRVTSFPGEDGQTPMNTFGTKLKMQSLH